jgi:hypothetical protein
MTSLKIIRSHIKDGGVGLQTLRRIRKADTRGGGNVGESIAEYTGKEVEEGDVVEEGAFVVGNKSMFDSQHGIARLANECRDGNVVSTAERKRVEDMTGRPMGCRDTNMKIYTDDDTKRTYLLASRNIEKNINEELLVQYESRDSDDDLDETQQIADEVDDGVGTQWPEDGRLGFGEYKDGDLVNVVPHDLAAPVHIPSEYPGLSAARVAEIRDSMDKRIRDDGERKNGTKLDRAISFLFSHFPMSFLCKSEINFRFRKS